MKLIKEYFFGILLLSFILTSLYLFYNHYNYLYIENKKLVSEIIPSLNNNFKKSNLEQLKKIEQNTKNLLLNTKIKENIENTNDINVHQLAILPISEELNNQILKELKQEYLKLREYYKIKNYLKQKTEQEAREIYGQKIKLSIPSIGLEVDTLSARTFQNNSPDGFLKEIDKYLMDGPVRYSHKDIIDVGVTLIFAHSAQNKNHKNYSFFRKLPLLKLTDTFSFTSSRKIYNYEILDSFEIETLDVINKAIEYEKLYPNEKLVFLITCYPINTNKKRWVVVGKQKK